MPVNGAGLWCQNERLCWIMLWVAYERASLSRFMNWCTAEAIASATVCQGDVDRFVVALSTSSLT